MAFDAHKNFAYSLVVTAPSPPTSGLTIVIRSGEGVLFPTPPFNASVWPAGQLPTAANAEVVRVTAKAGETLTVSRGQEGSTLRSIVAGDQIAATITAKTLTDVEAAIAAVTAGAWQDVPYNAADYTSSAGTFTVEAADLVGYKYVVLQKSLLLQFAITTASLTGSPGWLGIKLPAGLVAAGGWPTPFWYYDTSGGVWKTGFAQIGPGATVIQLFTTPSGGPFTNNTNQTYIYASFTIPLQ